MKSKESIRNETLRKRLALTPQQVRDLSRVIGQRVLGVEEYLKAESVALYSPFRNEVLTDVIAEKALADQKAVYFPQWNPKEKVIRFFRITSLHDLQTTLWGIQEPIPLQHHENRALIFDLILVPGVAFDLKANRLGYGVGGYDRLLAKAQGVTWGLAFDLQVVDKLPCDPHDAPVTEVITESRVIVRS